MCYSTKKRLASATQSSELLKMMQDDISSFFQRHKMLLRMNSLPLKFPPWASNLTSIVRLGKEMTPFTTVYRHMCSLKHRILSNWSYIEACENRPDHERNRIMPFQLRSLTPEIESQLDAMTNDLDDPDFSGVLITINSSPFTQAGLPATQSLSKVVGGALVEALVTNERCIKAIWIHPQLSTKSTRLVLQAFIPFIIMNAFECQVPSLAEGASPHKFVYAMHDDLDRWPRQVWPLFASSKKFALLRHYDISANTESHVQDEFGQSFHTDPGVSEPFVKCNCKIKKEKLHPDEQTWLERMVGCSEEYMLQKLARVPPKTSSVDTSPLWKDFIYPDVDLELLNDINSLFPSEKPTARSHEINFVRDEWCDLEAKDLVDLTSDSEYIETSPSPVKRQKRVNSRKK